MTDRPAFRWLLPVVGLAWIGVVPLGFTLLEREEFTPLATDVVSDHFPAGSAIKLAPDKPTLVLFFHPYCPCSRATLTELDRVRAETDNKLATTVVFTIATGEPAGWDQAALWKSVHAMPGITVLCDPGGGEARRFAVNGSGHALLYAATGNLLFSGGITGSRGHEGDNPGASAVVSLVLRGTAPVTRTPVFGCSLL